MNVSIFGLGYVGCVTAACLAAEGHHVLGTDINVNKVNSINAGQSPIHEPQLDQLLRTAVQKGNLAATQDTPAAVAHADLCMICVGTPSSRNGRLDLQYVERVCVEIGRALATEPGYKVIVVRSTLLPGTVRDLLIPLLSRTSGKKVGRDFGVAVNPEFLREGTAIRDFKNPPFTIIGEFDERAGKVVASLYTTVNAPVFHTEPDVACMVKYASNAYHALKVTFANEMGQICQAQGIDAEKVMEVFTQDSFLNISARYLKPGFAFGGSCLPKDLRAIVYHARHSDVDIPMLASVLPSNDRQIQRVVEIIERTGMRHIAVMGLSFKPDTDDIRESPTVRLVEALLGKGLELSIYDKTVNLSQLVGSSRAFIDQAVPHIAALTADSLESALEQAEVVIASHGMTEELRKMLRPGQVLIDLEHLFAKAAEVELATVRA